VSVQNAPQSSTAQTGTSRVKRGMADMLKGGVIMDVVTPEQAKIAEDAGAVAVMALERVPADIRVQGGVARMSDPDMIDGIISAVSIPVMAKCRIGHFVEAQVLQAIGVDYIDESEVLTPADEAHHVDKWDFTVPFVCGATNLGEALRRIIDMTVRRNAFGRQVDSFERDLDIKGIDGPPYRAVFIRAPWVEDVGPGVEILATDPGASRIVAVRQGRALATSFHPELTADWRIHEMFVDMVRERA
jgi:hypothetical protein